eukprot:5986931-Alexandrium_andersonii.AAC.1
MDEEDPAHAYDTLLGYMERTIQRERLKKNRQGAQGSHRIAVPGAPAPTGKPKRKPKAKAKAEGG